MISTSSSSSSTNLAVSNEASKSELPNPTQHPQTRTGTVPTQDELPEEVIDAGNDIHIAMRTLRSSSLLDLPPLSPRKRQDSPLQTSNVSLEDFGEDLCEWWQNEPTRSPQDKLAQLEEKSPANLAQRLLALVDANDPKWGPGVSSLDSPDLAGPNSTLHNATYALLVEMSERDDQSILMLAEGDPDSSSDSSSDYDQAIEVLSPKWPDSGSRARQGRAAQQPAAGASGDMVAAERESCAFAAAEISSKPRRFRFR